jgi:hypothetical protein
MTTAEQQRIAELEREVRELRQANEILNAASYAARRSAPPIPRRPVNGQLTWSSATLPPVHRTAFGWRSSHTSAPGPALCTWRL